MTLVTSDQQQPPQLGISAIVWETLLAIEQKADTWVIPNKPLDHTYGRLPGEIEIRAWSIPRNSGYFLLSLCRLLQPHAVLEIGTSFAYSTLWLACGAPKAEIHTIELLPEKLEIARRSIADAGLANIHLHEGEALEITNAWEIPLDLLFLDADPMNYIDYFKRLQPQFKTEIVLVMDNALDHQEQTQKFMDYMNRLDGWKTWIHPQDHGLFLATRR